MSLLVIRTSSMGDVIMTLPLLRSFAASYPDEELIFVTKKPYDRFVGDIPGVKLFLSDHHGRHKGFCGLLRAWKELRSRYKVTAVADLHDVIRSKIQACKVEAREGKAYRHSEAYGRSIR